MIFRALGEIVKSGDYINCLEVGIWAELLQSEDGHLRLSNVIKEAAIVKGAFTEIFSAVLRKNAR